MKFDLSNLNPEDVPPHLKEIVAQALEANKWSEEKKEALEALREKCHDKDENEINFIFWQEMQEHCRSYNEAIEMMAAFSKIWKRIKKSQFGIPVRLLPYFTKALITRMKVVETAMAERVALEDAFEARKPEIIKKFIQENDE